VNPRTPDRDVVLIQTVVQLLGLTTLPLLLMAGRVAYTGSLTHTHIVWNLLLAWLPLAFAYLAVRPRPTPLPLRLAYCLAWLLFLPNAPYLVTDMIHLTYGSGIPLLYDVVLLFSAALCGIVSLRWIQAAVAARLGTWPGRLFVLASLGMAGFGIYLGRYLHWNSWDIVLRPVALARDIWLHVSHPIQHWHAWALALLFAALLSFAYGLLAILGEAKHPPAGLRRPPDAGGGRSGRNPGPISS
jgi:uncharacterized membrane protein